MKHGHAKLGLITTDSYRVGAYEHLKTYGRILNVMVLSVKDETDLRIALEDMAGKHTILIDTVGMSQRDNMVASQIAMLNSAPRAVQRLLCVSATSNGETLNEIVKNYRGQGLSGCIMTKMDEAATIGAVLDIIIKNKLPLYSVANGQRVPEDLCSMTAAELVDVAFRLKNETPTFHLKDNEIGLIAGAMKNEAEKQLREVVNLG
jgi:flagellar biosynthesis protein FlhF